MRNEKTQQDKQRTTTHYTEN